MKNELEFFSLYAEDNKLVLQLHYWIVIIYIFYFIEKENEYSIYYGILIF